MDSLLLPGLKIVYQFSGIVIKAGRRDGANAHRVASDYVKEVIDIPADRKLKISMAPGGGCAMKIYKKP